MNMSKEEIEKLMVNAVTAFAIFERIPAKVLKEFANMGYFINFSPSGASYYFSDIQSQIGISMSLKGFKWKKDMVESLRNQITFIVNIWAENET